MAMRVISVMDGLQFGFRRPNFGTRCRGAVHPNGTAQCIPPSIGTGAGSHGRSPAWVGSSTAPAQSLGYNPAGKAAAKRRVGPNRRKLDQTVLDRIEMDVIEMAGGIPVARRSVCSQ